MEPHSTSPPETFPGTAGPGRALQAARALTALTFVVAGALHFVYPEAYERIVPDQLPAHGALVAISGVAEIAGGVGLLLPRFRRSAGWGLVALLVAVFPANVNMALHPQTVGGGVEPWALWARAALQPALIAAVLVVSRPDRRDERS